MTRAVLAHPFTLHPNALRKLGVAVPDPEPALVPSWTHIPSSPKKVPRPVKNSLDHIEWILNTSK
jgi:hypothetical protein